MGSSRTIESRRSDASWQSVKKLQHPARWRRLMQQIDVDVGREVQAVDWGGSTAPDTPAGAVTSAITDAQSAPAPHAQGTRAE
jgi:hypothetical protein